MYEVPPLEQDEEQPPRPGPWVRWVALVVVLAMVLATPFIYVLSRRGREPRRILVATGQTVRFAPGSVEHGDTVVCAGGAGAAIPGPGQGVTGYADGPSGGSSIVVQVAPDGSVTVHCGL